MESNIEKMLAEGVQFFTDEQVNITRFVSEKRTAITTDRKFAEADALKKQSYMYDVLTANTTKSRPVFFGYAVPN